LIRRPFIRPVGTVTFMHTAEAQRCAERNYIGQTVNRCARLRAVAHGGQVVVSDNCERSGSVL
jgi:class 3 adenylate cyclase